MQLEKSYNQKDIKGIRNRRFHAPFYSSAEAFNGG